MMLRVLLTGVSGVGKSTVITRLAALGHWTVDTDYDGWCAPSPNPGLDPDTLAETTPSKPTAEPGWVWNEPRMRRLLDTAAAADAATRPASSTANVANAADAQILFVSGCVPNQGKFYPDFDHIILLSAPDELVRQRLIARTGNPYGEAPGELAQALRDKQEVEPLLRAGATFEIDTSLPIDQVVDRILARVTATE